MYLPVRCEEPNRGDGVARKELVITSGEEQVDCSLCFDTKKGAKKRVMLCQRRS